LTDVITPSRVTVFLLTVLMMTLTGAVPAHSQSDEAKPGIVFEPHKLNYFIVNGVPPNTHAQMKYQISAKFKVVEFSDYRMYFSYTQKSYWDIGKPSMPFEETNYNPEIFIIRSIDRVFKPTQWPRGLVWHDITFGLLEHESNGLADPESRSWNRSYLASSFGLDSRKALEKTSALIDDRFLISLKLWVAYKTNDEEKYLESIGRGNEKNQIDFKSRIFQARNHPSLEFGYHQNIPGTNFYLYAQYWYGYNESLLRFAELDRRFKIGLSFFH